MREDKGHVLSLPLGRGQRNGAAERSHSLDRWLVGRLYEALGNPPLTIELWDGQRFGGDVSSAVARVTIHDRQALLSLLWQPELHFGDAYASGRIEVSGDIVRLLEESYLQLDEVDGGGLLQQVWRLLARIDRPRSNTLAGSREHIRHHYDLGNDFYRLWLDREMLYTCAYFARPELTLEEAQRAKLDHICRKLRLRPGEQVVEAGCGWGALARHMAREYGVRVKAFNISCEQVEYARERAEAEGLADRVEYILDDYREISGRFDAFVSVGMLEHVGTEHYRQLGETIDRSLTAGGRGLIHTIGRNRPGLMNGWIERRIFPGAYPPTLGEMMTILEPWSFSVVDVENLRLHYAETLRHWLGRFEAQVPHIEQMYDSGFVRAWRLYLAGSVAAFTTGSLQLFQVLFTRPRVNDLPPTRAHLYGGDPGGAA